ncbi:MAG: TraB/GumN family protein [Spirochaetaceae bacterium]
MIKGKIVLVSLLLLLVFSCKTAENKESIDNGTMFLWELKTEASTIYIAGSVHVASPDLYPLNKEYYTAIENSDNFVMEADIGEGNQDSILAYTMERAMFSGGDSLSNYIDDDFRDKLIHDALSKFGIPYSGVEVLKPWFLSTMLTVLTLQADGMDPENGVDQHFMSIAKSEGLKQYFLESAEGQIDMISSASIEKQVYELKKVVDEIDMILDSINELFTAWKLGDLKTFSDLFLDEFQDPESLEMYNTLLVDRNLNWAEQVDGFIDSGENYFMVVGAGHLVGADSLISILRDKGYKITRK